MDAGLNTGVVDRSGRGILRVNRSEIADLARNVSPLDAAFALRVPLYLAAGARPLRVYRDGPALVVAGIARRNTGRFPLNRVSRIVVSGRVEWAAAALTAVMEEGVTITFLGKAGEALGLLHPSRERLGSVASAIEEFLRNSQWKDVYENWLRFAKSRCAREWAKAEGRAALDERLRVTVYQAQTARARQRAAPDGWLVSVASERLAAAGLRPAYWGEGGLRLELARDLADLLRLDLDARLKTQGRRPAALGPADFEMHSAHLRGCCEQHVQDLLLRIRRFLADGA